MYPFRKQDKTVHGVAKGGEQSAQTEVSFCFSKLNLFINQLKICLLQTDCTMKIRKRSIVIVFLCILVFFIVLIYPLVVTIGRIARFSLAS